MPQARNTTQYRECIESLEDCSGDTGDTSRVGAGFNRFVPTHQDTLFFLAVVRGVPIVTRDVGHLHKDWVAVSRRRTVCHQ